MRKKLVIIIAEMMVVLVMGSMVMTMMDGGVSSDGVTQRPRFKSQLHHLLIV